MKAVYEAPYAIPELGVEPGDLITVRPAHPDNPLLVTRRHERGRLPLLLDHLEHLTPLEFSASSSPSVASEELRQLLLRRSPPPPPSLSLRRRLSLVP
jgi:hypothetical protein